MNIVKLPYDLFTKIVSEKQEWDFSHIPFDSFTISTSMYYHRTKQQVLDEFRGETITLAILKEIDKYLQNEVLINVERKENRLSVNVEQKWAKRNPITFEFSMDMENLELDIVDCGMDVEGTVGGNTPEQDERYARQLLTVINGVIEQLNIPVSYTKVEKREPLVTKISKNKNSKSKKHKHIVYVNKIIYTLESINHLPEKREFERKTPSWTVRGHWRTYKKSNTRVWIDTFIKGDKTKLPVDKTYVIKNQENIE